MLRTPIVHRTGGLGERLGSFSGFFFDKMRPDNLKNGRFRSECSLLRHSSVARTVKLYQYLLKMYFLGWRRGLASGHQGDSFGDYSACPATVKYVMASPTFVVSGFSMLAAIMYVPGGSGLMESTTSIVGRSRMTKLSPGVARE